MTKTAENWSATKLITLNLSDRETSKNSARTDWWESQFNRAFNVGEFKNITVQSGNLIAHSKSANSRTLLYRRKQRHSHCKTTLRLINNWQNFTIFRVEYDENHAIRKSLNFFNASTTISRWFEHRNKVIVFDIIWYARYLNGSINFIYSTSKCKSNCNSKVITPTRWSSSAKKDSIVREQK